MARSEIHPASTALMKLFKRDNGDPFHFYEGQKEIFNAICCKTPRRLFCITPTQYGKSESCACGVVARSTLKHEKWCIIGATDRKARVIMNYVLQHIFDNPIFFSEISGSVSLEKLKQEKSKDRITYRNGGEVFVLSAQAKNHKAMMDSLLSFGSPNIILDESPLLADEIYAMVKRMLGGSKDNFLLETGNPINRNHFYKSFKSAKNKVFIDDKMALAEGRFTKNYLDEMRKEMFYSILYECKFPVGNEIDALGWRPLASVELIDLAKSRGKAEKGRKKLGCDPGHGGDASSYVIRNDNYAWLKDKDQIKDLMVNVEKIQRFMHEEGIRQEDVYVDTLGIGEGVCDRLAELKIYVNRVGAGDKPSQEWKFVNGKRQYYTKYENKKAEMYWNLKDWLEAGGSLENNPAFDEISDNKWKFNSTGKVQMKSKQLLKIEGIDSPNTAEALAITFSDYQKPAGETGSDDFWYAGAGAVSTASNLATELGDLLPD